MKYFSYGSNMDAARMHLRCPGAVFIGGASLPDYALRERRYADIDRRRGASVAGVLWEVGADDLASLDAHEGVGAGIYRRREVPVDAGGTPTMAWVYELTPDAKRVRRGMKYPAWYQDLCFRGARAAGVDARPFASLLVAEVVVYGTLMTGERNCELARTLTPVLAVTIRGALYDTGYGYPCFFPDAASTTAVRGQLITVDMPTLKRMDRLEGVPHLFERRRIKYARAHRTAGEAWVYVMRDMPAGATRIKCNDWSAYRQQMETNQQKTQLEE